MPALELFALAILASGSPAALTIVLVVFAITAIATPWRTAKEAADRARVGVKVIYREVASGRLKAARVGNRRDLRPLDQWIDQWLESSAEPLMVVPRKRA